MTNIITPAEAPPEAVSVDLHQENYESMSLEQLAKEIHKNHKDAVEFAEIAKNTVKSTIQKVVAVGNALIAAKAKLRHGQWTEWREQNVNTLSEDQANRYIRLAKQIPHMRNLNELASVRQAYLAAGIIKDTTKSISKSEEMKPDSGSGSSAVDLLEWLNSIETRMTQVKNSPGFQGISSEERKLIRLKIKKTIAKLIKLQSQLGAEAENHQSEIDG